MNFTSTQSVKEILQEDFNFEKNWKPILSKLFNDIVYFLKPSNPFFENKKVISGKQLGTVNLNDGKSLAIFQVEVDSSIRIDRNRVGLREIAAKHIDQHITHGALVFFYSESQLDYRFSFIAKWSEFDLETGDFIKSETKPKRYTYLLGPNESCTTAAQRLMVLAEKKEHNQITIEDIKDAFSVEKLNKEFFKDYKWHYERFWKFIADKNEYRKILIDKAQTDTAKQEKPIRDFVKKLLGRIVFLHFLQKKGWMGCSANSEKWDDGEKQFMSKLFTDFQDKNHFHSKCLTKLFFDTLNNKQNKLFKIDGLKGNLNGSRVPYLNGGLFDTDKPIETQTFDFPSEFFNDLLVFFKQYNFTIDENSPDDHEVGIDPEMLGHIFENLLEENRERGAYYTPKEIVQYMTQQSLISYLQSHLGENDAIVNFIKNDEKGNLTDKHNFIRDNAAKIEKLLDSVKVCDPAIGSGAFPMGMLQEIFKAKMNLDSTLNRANVKKNIIQNSIYGVDIEKGAVDIAQLRFWLALVVNEDEPRPLPNLDFKIMQGDSLLESYEGIDLSRLGKAEQEIIVSERKQLTLDGFEPKVQQLTVFDAVTHEQITTLIKKYFDPESWIRKTGEKVDKNKVRKQINDIVEGKIHSQILKEKRSYEELISNYEKQWQIKSEEDYKKVNQKSKAFKAYLNHKKMFARFDAIEQNLIKLQHKDEKPYFLWHLYFKDIFDKGGFDIVIGNPPYIQLQKNGGALAEKYKNQNFETFTRMGDIYSLFYEKGFQLLKPKGIHTFITSNKWMRAAYGKKLRGYFSKLNPLLLLDLGPGVFESATVDTNVLVAQHSENKNKLKAVSVENAKEILHLKEEQMSDMENVSEEIWTVLSPEDIQIKKQIEKVGTPLKVWDIKINRGVVTGFNEAFIISGEKKNELIAADPKNAEIIKPILRGRDIKRYRAEFADLWLIATFPALNIDIDEYTAVRDYLKTFGKKLNQTGETYIDENGEEQKSRKKTFNKWFETQDPIGYFEEFEKEKVIWKRIGSIMRFSYSDNKELCLDSTVIASGKDAKYLTAVLNSKLILRELKNSAPKTGTGDMIISVQALTPLKVAFPNHTQRFKFENITDYILFLKDNRKLNLTENISNLFEEIVEQMVFELYFEEHMKENGIDILKFIDFPDISQMQSDDDKMKTIQQVYAKLQEKDNPIRNRLLLAEVRSPIIKRINESAF